ncbi:MAG: aromatic aminobenezylarsenical efflux permease ArsG family transporter [Bacteroidales bacterium]|nr:aromatic aminobenezylarsenical efflux permease ArsG family transporter [Bacteroidales bacterium]MCF8398420.1 aromatic aminobenezylarsenical efflux permease ArsG family transporter [Bacteroidales bacterium]
MEFLQEILDNTKWPIISAFILGLMTAISPCPLASNITAIAYISKDLQNRKKVFINGLVYTLGRAFSYTALGVVLFIGAGRLNFAGFFQQWGERILGPLLMLIGIFMLGIIRFSIPGFGNFNEKMEKVGRQGYLGVFLMGVVFALAFCPYSGILYFGLLIPMTIVSAKGLLLPLVFAAGTGLPVIIFAWLIAFTLNEVGLFYNRLKTFEKWFRKLIAIVFIAVGLYYVIIIYFNIL